MQAVYDAETGAESVFVYESRVYRVDEANGILPGNFQEMRFEADRPLSDSDLDALHTLVREHWDFVVDGLPLDDIFCDGDNAWSTYGKMLHSPVKARKLGQTFVSTLNDFIVTGNEHAPGVADVKLTVWVDEVYKEVS